MPLSLTPEEAGEKVCHRMSTARMATKNGKTEVEWIPVNCIADKCMLWDWVQRPGAPSTIKPSGWCRDNSR